MSGNTGFTLHPRLAADTIFVEDWPLSRVLLLNDARYVPGLRSCRVAPMPSNFTTFCRRIASVLMEEIARAGAGG